MECFGVEVLKVQEVIRYQNDARAAGRSHDRRLINLRGQIIAAD